MAPNDECVTRYMSAQTMQAIYNIGCVVNQPVGIRVMSTVCFFVRNVADPTVLRQTGRR